MLDEHKNGEDRALIDPTRNGDDQPPLGSLKWFVARNAELRRKESCNGRLDRKKTKKK